MSNGQGGAEQRLVTPGEALGSSSGLRNGTGVINKDGELIATKLGFTKILNNTISVSPTHSAYMPQSGDYIIGHVVEVRSNLWFIDIRGPFQGLLPMSLAPWKVEYGESRKHLNIGDALFARVQEVDESHNVVLTMKGVGLRKIAEGAIHRFPIHLIEGLTGSNASNLHLLREATNCRIIATDNGYLWFDGDKDSMAVLRDKLAKLKQFVSTEQMTTELKSIIG